jgi:segregation and condensation protein A
MIFPKYIYPLGIDGFMSSIMGFMEMKFSTNQVDSYNIKTSVYQGPLDLLLQLIENAELDITSLALAQVTDQYIKHLETMQDLPADEISAFLVIAAKLIQIKSEALLPRQASYSEDDEDLGDELARQLIAYKRYKEIAEILAVRKDHGYQSYIRLTAPHVEIHEELDLEGFGIRELFDLASNLFQKELQRKSISTVVERPKITIREKINEISDYFLRSKEITFSEFLGENFTRLDIVISFLALLELIKGKYVEVIQDAIFDEIKIVAVRESSEMKIYGLENREL